jgi:hypothetical protein
MTRNEIERLAAELDRHISPKGGCDGTLTWTRQYLAARGLDVEHEVAALQSAGAYCDCEVMMNVYCALSEPGLEN